MREFPAPAARKEQLSDRQYQQQRTQGRARCFRRCVAHVDLCFECHSQGAWGLNAKKGQMIEAM